MRALYFVENNLVDDKSDEFGNNCDIILVSLKKDVLASIESKAQTKRLL